MPKHDKARYRLEKTAGRRPRRDLPLATIAYYGPDDRHAAKVVASIVAPDDEIVAVEKRFSEDEDLRLSPAINKGFSTSSPATTWSCGGNDESHHPLPPRGEYRLPQR